MNGSRSLPLYNALVATGMLVLTMVSYGCRDKGVEPKPTVKDYKIYFAEPGTSGPYWLYAFHPTTHQIDSSQVTWNSRAGLVVSADGKRLYIGDRTKVVVVDAKTLIKITELPYPTLWPVAVSPDNNLVAVTGDDVTIFRSSDYSVVFHDTDRTISGRFSSDSKVFFCATYGPGELYKVDLSDPSFPVTRRRFADGSLHQLVPSGDGTKWFLYLDVMSGLSAFEVYEVQTDSILFSEFLSPGFGWCDLMPNENYLFYTNPGTPQDGPPPLDFTVFDVQKNTVKRVIFDTALFTIGNYKYPPNEMVVTPDNRWLILWGGATSAKVVYLYDIQDDTVVYRQDWGGIPKELTNPSVQIEE